MHTLPPALRHCAKLIGAVLLSLGCAPIIRAQTPPKNQEPVAKSIVRGRVIYEDSQRPVRRAMVRLMQGPTTGPGNHSAPTDLDGNFVIKGLPAGHFVVWVDAPGVISPIGFMTMSERGPESWSETDINANFTAVETDGTNAVDVKIQARRGGAIAGQIKYADGDPVVNAQISIVRRVGKQTVRVIGGISPATLFSLATDDRGKYRIFGLPPGEYLVAVVETHTVSQKTNDNHYQRDDFFNSDSLATYFYGPTGKLPDATTVKVEAGADLTDVDITIPDLLTHSIGGTVTAHLDGIAVPGTTITIVNRDQAGWFLKGTQQMQTDEQGQWSLAGVPDGSYNLAIAPPSEFPPSRREGEQTTDGDQASASQQKQVPKRHFVAKQIDLTVTGQDVTNLEVELPEGATVSGSVELPGSVDVSGSEEGESQGLWVAVNWVYEDRKPDDDNHVAGVFNHQFTLDGLEAGRIFLSASINERGEQTKKFYVKSISLNGRDLKKEPLTIKEGERIQNVRIVIASDLANADVLLVDNEGKPLPGKIAAIAPVESSRWLFGGAVVISTSDEKGVIHFSGEPGEFLVIVAVDGEKASASFIEYLRAHADSAPHIKLQPGTNKAITVMLPH